MLRLLRRLDWERNHFVRWCCIQPATTWYRNLSSELRWYVDLPPIWANHTMSTCSFFLPLVPVLRKNKNLNHPARYADLAKWPTYRKPSTNTTATAVVGSERINRSLRLSRRPYSSLSKPELYRHPLLPTGPSEQRSTASFLGFVLGRANAFLDSRVADTGCLKMYRSYRGDSLEAVVDQL